MLRLHRRPGRGTRRELLCGVGTVASLGTVGCTVLGPRKPVYRLTAQPLGASLARAFLLQWSSIPPADRPLVTRLVTDGRLPTTGFTVIGGLTTDPRYLEHEGSYYEIVVARTGTVTRERWILWFDLIEGDPPPDAAVFTSSLGRGEGTNLAERYGLAEADVQTVEDAVGQLPTEFELRDLEDAPPGHRGHVFVRRTPEDTALLPEPPFTHVAFDRGDATRYARAVTEQSPVELQTYSHTATPVAEGYDAYATAVRDAHLTTRFDRPARSPAAQEILEAIDPRVGTPGTRDGQPLDPDAGYAERPPLSDAFQAVLARLGLADLAPQGDGVTTSEPVYYADQDAYFAAQLTIR